MLIIAICAAVVAAGLVLVARAHARGAARPAACGATSLVCLGAGLGAGLIAAGAGGRLVMRLLALTSPDAHGAITEAEATIGEITPRRHARLRACSSGSRRAP